MNDNDWPILCIQCTWKGTIGDLKELRRMDEFVLEEVPCPGCNKLTLADCDNCDID